MLIADRSRVGLEITLEQPGNLPAGESKRMTIASSQLDLPGFDKLALAVRLGINDCIKLYNEKPPKGSKDNFGFAAYKRWIEVLTKPKARLSWAGNSFPVAKLYSGLITTYTSIMVDGKDGQAEHQMFAIFSGKLPSSCKSLA